MFDLPFDFEFLRPEMLWLILPVLVLMFLWRPKIATTSAWQKVCAPKFLNYLLIKNEKKSKKGVRFAIWCALLSAVFALAGPSFKKLETPSLSLQNPLMILLDLSSEMNRTDVRPSRLSRAKIEITDLLKQSGASPSGLIVYTDEPFLISPLSEDSEIIINLLKAVNTDIMPVEGNRPDRAIDLAVQRFKESGFYSGNIILFSSNIEEKTALLAFQSAKNAHADHITLSVFDTSVAPSETLQKLAKTGGGVYLNITQNNNKALLNLLLQSAQKNLKESQNKTLTAQDNGWWFVALTAVFMLFIFKRGLFVLLLFVFLSPQTNAGILFNTDQEGALYFSSKEYSKAAEQFKNKKWKAAAYYKAGDYQKAVSLFEKQTDIESLYNKGNALAKSGDIEGAIKTYEKVLEQDPKHEDAAYNLEYLKNLKQNEQQSQSQNQNDENQDQSSDQNDDKNDENKDNQDQEQQSASDENSDTEDEKEAESKPEESGFDEDNNKPDDQSKEQNQNDQNNLENENSMEQIEVPNLPAKEEQADEYNETVQAREQKFREIKEDTGGLLRAFIYEEYSKKRYTK